MRLGTIASLALAATSLLPTSASAHCDGLDGPVVAAARKALASGDPNPVLIWVQPKDEAEVRRVFTEAIAVRKLNAQAREMADRYFFETLVRVHRAGESAPYTGLKPAGRDLGPAITLADKAVATGSESDLAAFASKEVERGIHEKFADLSASATSDPMTWRQDANTSRAMSPSCTMWRDFTKPLDPALPDIIRRDSTPQKSITNEA